MQVKVKLYGTLSHRLPEYRHSEGIEVELANGATTKDLLALLEISEVQGVVVIAENRILKVDDKIRAGVPVNVLQSISGG
jgi:sulfur carrier protein ThiS